MRTRLLPIHLLAAAATLTLSITAHAAPRVFTAHMNGAQENPPVETNAQGEAVFRLSDDGSALSYRLVVSNIADVRFSHIHMAPAGQNGPIVVTLFPGPTLSGRVQGVIAEGTITAANLQGALAGMTLADLVAQIDAGNTYVNVHTDAHPPGEIRGQIASR